MTITVQTWLLLAVAIICEVIATSALKASANFTRLIPTVIVVLGYGAAFYLLTIVLRSLPIGITYAIWSGAGIVLISLVGWLVYQQTLDAPAILGIALIVAGVLVLNLFSRSIAH